MDKVYEVSVEVPKYRCHKEVRAMRIDRIEYDSATRGTNEETDGSAKLFDDRIMGVVSVDSEFVRRHKPQAGGYFVIYEDGYKSFSPAKAFEDGYTRI